MKLHPSVARVIAEAVTSIAVKCLSPGPTHARGFYPPKNHPNLKIEFETCDTGDHPILNSGTVNIQWAGDHPGSKINGIYISCIHHNQGGRYTAVFLDHIAANGGRLKDSFYFSWQGQLSSGMDPERVGSILFEKLKAAFGTPALEFPNKKDHQELYEAAGIDVSDFKGQQEAVPEILKGKTELMPAYKVLSKAGVNFSNITPGSLSTIQAPSDISHQNLIQKALDDMKDAGIIDYDVSYDKGKMSTISVMVTEGIDNSKNVAISESMDKSNPVRIIGTLDHKWMSVVECEHQGMRFGFDKVNEVGSVYYINEDNKLMLVGTFQKKKNVVNMIREAAKRIKTHGITETVKMQWDNPINEEAR